MRQRIILSCFCFTVVFAGYSQTYTASVTDTLHYYFNKYYLKTGSTNLASYPAYSVPSKTNVTHFGSRFDNASGSLTVTGLEAFAAKTGTTASTYISVHMYLCNVGNDGLPQFPPIDSIYNTGVGHGAVYTPSVIGGNFTTPRVVTGNFAVLIQNMSSVSGDTVLLLRTAGRTYTNTSAPASQRYSDGDYSFIRHAAAFKTTRNFTLAPGFGAGTDYEFMVAPRVKYEVQASQLVSQNIIDFDNQLIDTLCARSTVLSFTNTSSYQFTNRFYNLNEFYRKWNLISPFLGAPLGSGGFSTDSAITWNFEYEELALPVRDPRTYLKYVNTGINQGSITSVTHMADCFDNQFRAKLRPMGAFGRQQQVSLVIPFKVCLKFCNGDGVGISEQGSLSSLRFFPNPVSDGTAVISGLSGVSMITVDNILGQHILSLQAEKESAAIDLRDQPPGTYFMRITNDLRQSGVIRVVIAH